MADIKGKVVAGKILIKPAEAEEKTAGGIYIPDSAKEKPLQGEVILIGEIPKDETSNIKVGDQVLYGKYAGTELEIEGKTYLLLSMKDVLYVF
jgi:chaperonin GroES